MPAVAVIDNPPAQVLAGLSGLRAALDAQLPAKDKSHLLLGTWNVRALGGLTPQWDSSPGDSPKRNLADLADSPPF